MLNRTIRVLLFAVLFCFGREAGAREFVIVAAGKLRVRETGREMEGGGWNLHANGCAGDWFTASRSRSIYINIRAAGVPAKKEFPLVRLLVGPLLAEKEVAKLRIGSKEFEDYKFKVPIDKGTFSIKVEYLNDLYEEDKWDRDVLLERFVVDGAVLAEEVPNVKDATDESIREHRTGELTVIASPGAEVRATQLSHEFWFGTAISHGAFNDGKGDESDRDKFREVLGKNFNSAVHENALKWYSTEYDGPGKLNWADADKILQWCEENDIKMRGHCIFWGAERYVQDWIKDLDDRELAEALEKRGRDVTSRYKGRITEYDLNNEMLHENYYEKRLGKNITADMAKWARTGDPDAVLYVNDYNVLTGNKVDKYAAQIKGLLKQQVPIGGIGCQGHFDKGVNVGTVNRALDTLAEFGLPIRITEFDINMDDEEAKAKHLEDFYRVCFAHPAVTGILMWGFWEGAHWRPKAALWKKDWSPTPAAEKYDDLVYNEWWTKYEGKVDGEGKCVISAFFGNYLIETGNEMKMIEFSRAEGTKTVNF